MQTSRCAIALLALGWCAEASAAVKWLSRANCVGGAINESVTYDRPQLKVTSCTRKAITWVSVLSVAMLLRRLGT
jgi:hypothetical protein